MKNKKIERILVKIGTSAFFGLLLGIVYRNGQEADDIIDKKYEKNHGISPKKLF